MKERSEQAAAGRNPLLVRRRTVLSWQSTATSALGRTIALKEMDSGVLTNLESN
jgi:hypothetical protein